MYVGLYSCPLTSMPHKGHLVTSKKILGIRARFVALQPDWPNLTYLMIYPKADDVLAITEDFNIFANRKSKQTCKLVDQIDDGLGCDIRSDWLIYTCILTSCLQRH